LYCHSRASNGPHGDVGVSPGTAIAGFPPAIVSGTVHAGDAVAAQAPSDLGTACGTQPVRPAAPRSRGRIWRGLTLTPGIHCFASSAALTGTLTLDAKGDPAAHFLFQIGSTLTTAVGSTVNLTGGGFGANVFYQVGSAATLGGNTAFTGNILALTSIGLGTGASIRCGRALASNGAVTLDTSTITIDGTGCQPVLLPVAEPDATALFGALAMLGLTCGGAGRAFSAARNRPRRDWQNHRTLPIFQACVGVRSNRGMKAARSCRGASSWARCST